MVVALMAITFTSCKEQTVVSGDIPVEVMQLKDLNKFDTVLVINTDNSVYLFENKTNKPIGKYNRITEDLFPLGLFLGFVFTVVVGIAIFA